MAKERFEEEDDGETDMFKGISMFQTRFPTMIFCNPNAGFAEFFQYQSDWLDYYVEHGINVIVWNYRGFGMSEGTPDPNKLKEDAELIAAYVRA